MRTNYHNHRISITSTSCNIITNCHSGLQQLCFVTSIILGWQQFVILKNFWHVWRWRHCYNVVVKVVQSSIDIIFVITWCSHWTRWCSLGASLAAAWRCMQRYNGWLRRNRHVVVRHVRAGWCRRREPIDARHQLCQIRELDVDGCHRCHWRLGFLAELSEQFLYAAWARPLHEQLMCMTVADVTNLVETAKLQSSVAVNRWSYVVNISTAQHLNYTQLHTLQQSCITCDMTHNYEASAVN